VESDDPVNFLHHHPHRHIKLEESKVDDVLTFGEMCQKQFLRWVEFVFSKEAHHVRGEVSSFYLAFFRSQGEVIEEIVEVVGDPKVHLGHEASRSIRLQRREPLYQPLTLLFPFYPLEVSLREGHGEGIPIQVIGIDVEKLCPGQRCNIVLILRAVSL
jgi:hypothetical protein